MAEKRSLKPENDTASLERFAKKAIQYLKTQKGGHAVDHKGHAASVRKAEYKNHTIAIKTQYEIRIDGRLAPIPLAVDLDGRVMCHALPTYSFQSAIDLVKQIIDNYPDDFRVKHHGHHGKRRNDGGHS